MSKSRRSTATSEASDEQGYASCLAPRVRMRHLPLPGQNHHRRILRRLLHKPPRNACPSALSVVKQASFVDPYRLVLVGDVFPDEVSEHLVECSEASCKPNT